MRRRALLIFCILSLFSKVTKGENDTSTSASVTDEVVKKIPSRIVNGTRAFLGQFPQQVSLRRRFSQSHFCGGSILTSSWVISAGHCMFDYSMNLIPAFSIIIVAGEIRLKKTNRARQWSYVKKYVVHPEFDLQTLYNDVSLLQLETPLTFDPFVKPVKITQQPYEPGVECQVSGWGYKKFEIPIVSDTLLYVDVPLLPIDLCRELLKNYTEVPTGAFCAGYLEGGRDACQGDSGGGLLCEGQLTGVVSGGEGCAWPRLPGLYTEVQFYSAWIGEHVNLSAESPAPVRPPLLLLPPLPFGRNSGTATKPRLFLVRDSTAIVALVACLIYWA